MPERAVPACWQAHRDDPGQQKSHHNLNRNGDDDVDQGPTLDSWKEVLGNPNSLNSMINSAAVALGTTVLVLILGTPAAYSLARYEFVIGSKDIALWFLSQRVLPPVVVLVPFYVLMVHLRLLDTWLGLILAYSTFDLAFCVVIMRDIFRDVSKEVEEAARIEGAKFLANFLDDRVAAFVGRIDRHGGDCLLLFLE